MAYRSVKRLGIFTFYDAMGLVDEYVEVLLRWVEEALDRLVIIVNGQITQTSYQQLEKYAEQIFIRNNIGYDAGAYKDALLHYIPEAEWKNYDEIVCFNDTFFGPLNSKQNLWKIFEHVNADFWGISRHPCGKIWEGRYVPSHIQAYFIVFRKSLFGDKSFIDFWDRLSYPKTYDEAIWNFEIGLTSFFEEKGFKGVSLMDLRSENCKMEDTENPYMYHSYRLIKYMDVPFLKKKCFQFESMGYIDSINALEYIDRELDYDSKVIWANIYRLCKNKLFHTLFDYNKLELFYYSHARIFLYGAGSYGKKLERYFKYREWRFENFIVSEDIGEAENCKLYKDVKFEKTDGIILALGQKNVRKVYESIKQDLSDEQIFLPEEV